MGRLKIFAPFSSCLLAFVAFTTDTGAGRTLTDTRSLDEDGAAIKMELELTTPDATIALTRWLVKSEPPKAPAEDDEEEE